MHLQTGGPMPSIEGVRSFLEFDHTNVCRKEGIH